MLLTFIDLICVQITQILSFQQQEIKQKVQTSFGPTDLWSVKDFTFGLSYTLGLTNTAARPRWIKWSETEAAGQRWYQMV